MKKLEATLQGRPLIILGFSMEASVPFRSSINHGALDYPDKVKGEKKKKKKSSSSVLLNE